MTWGEPESDGPGRAGAKDGFPAGRVWTRPQAATTPASADEPTTKAAPGTALVSRALRGALVGLAVWGASVWAFTHAERAVLEAEAANPVDNGVGVLVAIV